MSKFEQIIQMCSGVVQIEYSIEFIRNHKETAGYTWKKDNI
mgnify:CR=1 FL=1